MIWLLKNLCDAGYLINFSYCLRALIFDSIILLQTPGTTQANAESDAVKVSEGKDRPTSKRSRGASGNHGLVAAKVAESGKAASESGNDGATQRYFDDFIVELLLD